VAVIYLIWAGFKYVTAGGDSKQAGEAKEGITHAIIGLAIAFIGYLLVQFVYTALQVDQGIQDNTFNP
jgi:threonine/homoserine/homoserine lactone efflux protein